jgi:hypothetical protein
MLFFLKAKQVKKKYLKEMDLHIPGIITDISFENNYLTPEILSAIQSDIMSELYHRIGVSLLVSHADIATQLKGMIRSQYPKFNWGFIRSRVIEDMVTIITSTRNQILMQAEQMNGSTSQVTRKMAPTRRKARIEF